MRKILLQSLAVLMLASATAFAASIEGEIVDSRCYQGMGKHGAEHQMCGQMCLKGGLPAGILTSSGKYYTLLVQGSAFADVVGQKARVEGKVDEKSSTIVPLKVEVNKGGTWTAVKLPNQMM